MLLQVRHLGIKDHTRLYAVQSPTGNDGIIALQTAHVKNDEPPRIEIQLAGTAYFREYPASGELDAGSPPRISDLAGGYGTVAGFIATWEHSTTEQRADLWLYDKPLALGRFGFDGKQWKLLDRKIRNRSKWPARTLDDRPRVVEGKELDRGWITIYKTDLLAAIKGTKSAVRVGSVTIKPSILRQLLDKKGQFHDSTVDLADHDGELAFRSPDKRAECTIKHGAGDPYAGRNGFEAVVRLAS